jgi:hypothetical protein
MGLSLFGFLATKTTKRHEKLLLLAVWLGHFGCHSGLRAMAMGSFAFVFFRG